MFFLSSFHLSQGLCPKGLPKGLLQRAPPKALSFPALLNSISAAPLQSMSAQTPKGPARCSSPLTGTCDSPSVSSPRATCVRRDSWLAPAKGRFTCGVSLVHVSDEVEILLGSGAEDRIVFAMQKVLSGLKGCRQMYGVVLCFANGEVGLLCCGVKGVKKVEVRKEGSMFHACCLVDDVQMENNRIIAATMSKLMDEEKKIWWISRSGFNFRIKSIIKHIGDKNSNNRYLPCLFNIINEDVKINIRSAFLKDEFGEQIREDRKKFKEIMGTPIYDSSSCLTKKVIFNTEMKDEKVRDRFNKLRKYIMIESKLNIVRRNIFRKVMTRISENGSPDEECLDMMQMINEDGEKEKRALYRIGAFLQNGGFFLEFTRYANKSKDIGWLLVTCGAFACVA